MAATDYLKTVRDDGYNDNSGSDNDPDAPNRTSRTIKLTDDEQKSLEQAKPGEEVTLEVRGNVEGDHFHVMSLSMQQGAPDPNSEQGMAREVAQKIQPGIM